MTSVRRDTYTVGSYGGVKPDYDGRLLLWLKGTRGNCYPQLWHDDIVKGVGGFQKGPVKNFEEAQPHELVASYRLVRSDPASLGDLILLERFASPVPFVPAVDIVQSALSFEMKRFADSGAPVTKECGHHDFEFPKCDCEDPPGERPHIFP